MLKLLKFYIYSFCVGGGVRAILYFIFKNQVLELNMAFFFQIEFKLKFL